MKISILTLFPEMFQGPFDYSIVKRAKEKNLVTVEFVNIRESGIGRHRIVDDTPYGGGIGMVMRVDVLHTTIQNAKCQMPNDQCSEKVVLLSASGKPFTQQKAQEYAELDHLILISGHYEGVDDRVKNFIDEEISVGDFIVTGGEIPAMLIADSVIRLIPGVLPEGATADESFATNGEIQNFPLLEYPQYTKPQTYKNISIPEILLSGDHAKIKKWRSEQAMERTKKVRPDLLRRE